jgi:hypothetical protein
MCTSTVLDPLSVHPQPIIQAVDRLSVAVKLHCGVSQTDNQLQVITHRNCIFRSADIDKILSLDKVGKDCDKFV